MAARIPAQRRVADKNCKEITDLLMHYLTGKLSASTTRAFQEHLRICPDCVSFLNTYKKTVALNRSLRYEEIPAELRRRVRSFLKSKIGES